MSNWVVIILGGTGNVFLLCQVGDLGDGNYFLAPDSINAGQAIKKFRFYEEVNPRSKIQLIN
jgi:hypothetical protein